VYAGEKTDGWVSFGGIIFLVSPKQREGNDAPKRGEK